MSTAELGLILQEILEDGASINVDDLIDTPSFDTGCEELAIKYLGFADERPELLESCILVLTAVKSSWPLLEDRLIQLLSCICVANYWLASSYVEYAGMSQQLASKIWQTFDSLSKPKQLLYYCDDRVRALIKKSKLALSEHA